MTYTTKKWEILHKTRSKDDQPLAKTIDGIIDILLKNRGISSEKDIKSFLHPSLDSITASAVGLDVKEVKKAIERISHAIKKQESVVVYSDYDADGIAAAAI